MTQRELQNGSTAEAVERLRAEIEALEARVATAKRELAPDAREAARDAEAAQVERILRRLQHDVSLFETNYIAYLKV